MRFLTIVTMLALAACSNEASSVSNNTTVSPEVTNAQAVEEQTSDTVETTGGRYAVSIKANFDPATLPSNADMKMVNFDVVKYAVEKCGLTYKAVNPVKQCDVFVQPDRSGLLVGYAFLMESDDTRIATETVKSKGDRKGCFIEGKLSVYPEDANLKLSGDVEAQLPFNVTTREDGEKLVSTGADDIANDDPNASAGMWYIKKQNGNLRITQERWNYCYDNEYIDEVMKPLVTLTRL